VHHRYQGFLWKIATGAKDICGKFATVANKTGSKFATGVNTSVANQNSIKLLTP
jgi:hypothetical protein